MAVSPRSRFTPREASLIRQSFAKICLNPAEMSARFYQRLFTLEPSVRGLFHGDMREQGRKLISTLTLVVDSLDHFEKLLPTVHELGVRHANYRVEERHYATVGEALLWAFQETAGKSFTPSSRAAWAKAYALLAGEMIAGARAVHAKAGPP